MKPLEVVSPDQFGVYRGRPTNRVLQAIEANWQKEGMPVGSLQNEIYFRLSSKLEQANNERKKKVSFTVLDFGCGENAQALSDLLSFSDSRESRFRRLLERYPNITVDLRLLGITAAKNGEENMHTPFDITQFSKDNPQLASLPNLTVSGDIYHYSVTKEQTLKDFLATALGNNEHKGLDVVYANASLTYLVPHVFKNVLEDIINVLEPRGIFVGYEISTAPGVFLSPATRRKTTRQQTQFSPYIMEQTLKEMEQTIAESPAQTHEEYTAQLLPYFTKIAKLRNVLASRLPEEFMDEFAPTTLPDTLSKQRAQQVAHDLGNEIEIYTAVIDKIVRKHMLWKKHTIIGDLLKRHEHIQLIIPDFFSDPNDPRSKELFDFFVLQKEARSQ